MLSSRSIERIRAFLPGRRFTRQPNQYLRTCNIRTLLQSESSGFLNLDGFACSCHKDRFDPYVPFGLSNFLDTIKE